MSRELSTARVICGDNPPREIVAGTTKYAAWLFTLNACWPLAKHGMGVSVPILASGFGVGISVHFLKRYLARFPEESRAGILAKIFDQITGSIEHAGMLQVPYLLTYFLVHRWSNAAMTGVSAMNLVGGAAIKNWSLITDCYRALTWRRPEASDDIEMGVDEHDNMLINNTNRLPWYRVLCC